jgi:hypothetical protein
MKVVTRIVLIAVFLVVCFVAMGSLEFHRAPLSIKRQAFDFENGMLGVLLGVVATVALCGIIEAVTLVRDWTGRGPTGRR